MNTKNIILICLILIISFSSYMYFTNQEKQSEPVKQEQVIEEKLEETQSEEQKEQPEIIEQETAEIVEPEIIEPQKEIITGEVKKGDTASVLLNTWFGSNTVQSLLEVTQDVYSLSKINVGQPFTIIKNNDGEMESFVYEIDSDKKLVVLNKDNKLQASLEDIEYEIELKLVKGVIEDSLFLAMVNSGEKDSLAINIAEIFAWEIDFIKDIRKGDSFTILVEKRYRDGEFKNYGKILAASFINQNKEYEAFRYVDGKGFTRFFGAGGESLERAILKSPLKFSRVSSGYTMKRKHPILGITRPHQGIDYAAPSGTPVKAVASGTVSIAGTVGGYGKHVRIKHAGSLESYYSHLSRYGKGVKKGVKVKQGQTIGYVGSTGLSTGPHLDFRLRKDGKFVNPTKVINPRIDDLEKKLMPKFKTTVEDYRKYIDGEKDLKDYKHIKE